MLLVMQMSGEKHFRFWEPHIQKCYGGNECVEESFEGQCGRSSLKVGKRQVQEYKKYTINFLEALYHF